MLDNLRDDLRFFATVARDYVIVLWERLTR